MTPATLIPPSRPLWSGDAPPPPPPSEPAPPGPVAPAPPAARRAARDERADRRVTVKRGSDLVELTITLGTQPAQRSGG